MQFDVNCATTETVHPEDELRQVIWGVSRQNWHILPKIDEFLERNKLPEGSRGTLLPQQPEVVISFDTGEQRHEIDRLQSSSNNLAADFVRAFGLEDRPEDLYSKPEVPPIAALANQLILFRLDSHVCRRTASLS
jgi:hypothetical protein